MITPVNPLPTRLIHTSPTYWTIYRSFEVILEWEPFIGLELKSNVICKYVNPLLQKALNLI